ncbi:MAG: hypothetical protein ABFD92_20640 [Planctomycetaceae bacterium]|nr:hypothetical protein [Planctomycetaceae bacterium]
MNRNDWIWIAIRIFGIYLLVLAVCALPDVINSGFNLWMFSRLHLGDVFASTQPEHLGFQIKKSYLQLTLTGLVSSAVKVIFFALAGWWMLRRGNLLFKLISRQGPPATATDTEPLPPA